MIFDCDGVLVDSELIACRAHAVHLTRHGYPISQDQVACRFLGRSLRDATLEIESELGRALPADFATQLKDDLTCRFAELLQAVPNVEKAVDALAIPVCVASSGSPEKIATNLRTVGLFARFAPNLFSATEVPHGKPAPDLFLHAAARMDVAPARCLVIEDSVPGITGALAAGMTALGFHGGSHCQPEHAATLRAAGAAAVYGDMLQLSVLIQELSSSPA